MKTIRITSRDNTAVKHMLQLKREKKARRAEGLMVLEGEKMLREAARAGARSLAQHFLPLEDHQPLGAARLLFTL